MGYEQGARQRVEKDLQHEKSVGLSERTALRQQLQNLQNVLDQARGEELPHDWPTVKRIWLEGTMLKQQDQRSRRALRSAQSMIEVLTGQLSAIRDEVASMHGHLATLEQQYFKRKQAHAEAQRASDQVCESMRHQLASAQAAWKDAERERLEAEQRCAEALRQLSLIKEEHETIANLQESLKEALEDSFLFEALYHRGA